MTNSFYLFSLTSGTLLLLLFYINLHSFYLSIPVFVRQCQEQRKNGLICSHPFSVMGNALKPQPQTGSPYRYFRWLPMVVSFPLVQSIDIAPIHSVLFTCTLLHVQSPRNQNLLFLFPSISSLVSLFFYPAPSTYISSLAASPDVFSPYVQNHFNPPLKALLKIYLFYEVCVQCVSEMIGSKSMLYQWY